MTIPLSEKTIKIINKLFGRSSKRVISELLNNVSENIPGCTNENMITMERIRFAVLKTVSGRIYKLEEAVKLAEIDYRDLLMAADFGFDTEAHQIWAASVLEGKNKRR